MLAIGLMYPSLYNSSTGKPYDGWVAQLCPKTDFAKPECDGALGHFHLTFNVIINEIICTFIFISVILTVTSEKISGKTDGVAIAISVVATLMGMIKTGMRLGACYNPAVGIALIVNANIWLTNSNNYLTHYSMAYLLGPTFGGIAAGLFHLAHVTTHRDTKSQGEDHGCNQMKTGSINHE